ncbi:MAG: (Fe-S)-binding protein [Planctomycetota bacterium]
MSQPTLLHDLDYSVLQQCMHCGLCLPTCPTYAETGRERSSPRGRIALMRAVADDAIGVTETFADEMEYCVGCLACQTACPAGVDYSHLLETARAEVERTGIREGRLRKFYRWLTLRVMFTRPWLLRLLARTLAVYQKPAIRSTIRRLGLLHLAPRHLRELEPKSPQFDPPFSFARIKPVEQPTTNPARKRVGLMVGCVQDVSYARINHATATVLRHNGCEVVTPRNQFCCGSLHAHNGDPETARELAERNLKQFKVRELDAIISNAGGCGSHMRRYADMFAGDGELHQLAIEWDSKVRDVHEWLAGIGFTPPSRSLGNVRVAYDDSCHLLHGQRVREQPRQLLQAIPDLELVPLAESDWCCGSAGIYSLLRPDSAEKLLERKLDHLQAAEPDIVATANPGCLLQLAVGMAQRPKLANVRIIHPVELLAESYGPCDGD